MIIKRKLYKEMLFIILHLIIILGFSLLPIDNNNISTKIGLAFILGFPIIPLFISFIRGLKRLPISCEIKDNELKLTYYNGQAINISLECIRDVQIKIHSQKTAILNINFIEYSKEMSNLRIISDSWDKFLEFSEQLFLALNNNEKVQILTMKDIAGRDCCVFNKSNDWREYLKKKKTINETFKEIFKEGILKKALLIVGFILIVFIETMKDSHDYNLFFLIVGVILILYLIISFFSRMIGYSGSESIILFIAGIPYTMLGLTAIYGIVMWLVKLCAA